METGEQHGLRLLSLDGGGIRGLSELVILEEIMSRVQKSQKLLKPALPCEYFDLICGTSTGGLIAILLGRLRLSVPEAIEQYSILSKTVFGSRKPIGKDGWYKASNLEDAIKHVLNTKLGPGHENEGMLEGKEKTSCRVFVCAVPGRNLSRPRLFRTYRVERNEEDDCKIWEAGRATSAAPMFFKRIEIGREGMKEEFVDAALGCNNPTKQLMLEAEAVFGDSRDIACIVSIGTGRSSVMSFKKPPLWQRFIPVDLIDALKKMATNSDSVAEQMAGDYKYFEKLYYRLNVEQGLENIRLEEWKTLGEVKTHTKTYLNQAAVSQSIEEIVWALVGKSSPKYMLRQLGAAKPISESHLIYSFPKGVSQFVNREEPLKQVVRLFQKRSNDEVDPTVVVLVGMGGSGKTQLALKYCRYTKLSQKYDSIFWVDASSPASTGRSFAAIRELIFNSKVDLAEANASVTKVTAEMSRWQTSWLIVFDNLDTPSLFDDEGINFRDYFPSGNRGAILVTSRNEEASRLANAGKSIDVNKMTEDEGIRLIVRVSGKESFEDGDRATWKSIISRLGYLALAIHQAGAYIGVRNLNPALFVEHYNIRREKILKEIPALWEYTKKLSDAETATALSVFTTWEMSLQQIKGEGINKRNKEHLLTASAFLDNKHINLHLFDSYFGHNSPGWMDIFVVDGALQQYKFEDVLSEFKNLSLLEILEPLEGYGTYFGIHPLIQDWVKLRLTLEHCQSYAVESIDLLAASSYDWGPTTMPLHSKRAFVAHMNAAMRNNELYQTKVWEDPKMKNASLSFAEFYRAHGHYADAEKLLNLSLAASRAEFGPEHLDTLQVMVSLAMVYDSKGDYPQAEILQEKVLGTIKAQFGDEHLDALASMHNLAVIYGNQGRYDDAERLGKQALEMKDRILGRNDLSTLGMATVLAGTYKSLGRYEEAQQLYHDVLNGIKIARNGTPGWDAALSIMYSLAGVYRLQRKYGEAESIYKDILQIKQSKWGPELHWTYDALVGLGLVYKDQNRNAEAAQFLQRALQGRKKVLGVDHPDTISTEELLESITDSKKEKEKENEKDEGSSSARTRWRTGMELILKEVWART